MAKTTRTTVATVNSTSLVPSTALTQAELPAKIAELKELLAQKRGTTDKTISLDISYNGKNIKNVDSVRELMDISASIFARSEASNNALVRHNLTDRNIAPFTVSDKTVEDWMKIIDKAVNELINKVEITTIEDTIRDFEDCLSTQDKMAAKLANNMAKLNAMIN